jgi:hypothetical protein
MSKVSHKLTNQHLLFETRVLNRIEKTVGCWTWLGNTKNGYGCILTPDGRQRKAHRVIYELLVGPVPADKVMDHLCRNKLCVNPAHLEVVTNKENVLRGIGRSAVNSRKTHCINGHKFTTENTRLDSRGKRVCRACFREIARKVRAARKDSP